MRALSIAAVALALAGCGKAPPPVPKVASAVELGTLQASPRVVGRDGSASWRVWDREVWTFGDTFLAAPDAHGFTFVSNTFATTSGPPRAGLPLEDVLDSAGAPAQLVRPTAEELAYDLAHQQHPDGGCDAQPCGGRWATWPTSIVFDPAGGGSALIFYELLTAAPGDFNFQGVGQGVAVWRAFDAEPERPAPGVCAGQAGVLFCADEPQFGIAAVEQDGTVYAFACTRDGLAFPCQLGRVPFARALEKGAWQFWDGSAWSGDLRAAKALFNGASAVHVFFNDAFGVWMALYAVPLDNRVVLRTAKELTGPWSDEALAFVPDRRDAGGDTYDAMAHPELAEQGGRVQYVTFSRPTGFFSSEFPLVRVTFE